MAATGRRLFIVLRYPFLALVDNCILRLAKIHQGSEGLLAEVVPLQHIDPRDFNCFLQPHKAGDEIECQILPARSAAGHDDALGFAT